MKYVLLFLLSSVTCAVLGVKLKKKPECQTPGNGNGNGNGNIEAADQGICGSRNGGKCYNSGCYICEEGEVVSASDGLCGDVIRACCSEKYVLSSASDRLLYSDAQVACQNIGMRLAMPKTSETWDELTDYLERTVGQTGLYAMGILSLPIRFIDGDPDGVNGFIMPKERPEWLNIPGEGCAYLKFEDNGWRVGDGPCVSVRYICELI